MYLFAHTCPTPAEDLALDEALLDRAERLAEQGESPSELEVLRLWEPRQTTVVIGRSSSLSSEVDVQECARQGVPILRRTSGGAAVVMGTGCLMYSVVLSYVSRPELRAIDVAHRFVLEGVLRAVRRHVPQAERRGTSDLALAERKFSGNSLRCRRNHMLYHGTLLYDFPLATLATLLAYAPRQPEYRAARNHLEFVGNLPIGREMLIAGLVEEFGAANEYAPHLCVELLAEARTLAAQKYSDPEWNARIP
ncbi:MAG: lipoate--protein ligase family protein [Planctomycetia bacterium]|nr:lipoate--protein ligase family protein [Planctomycetia bacterium]